MKIHYLLLFILPLVISCSPAKKERKTTSTKSDALIIGDPMDCGLDSLTIFPVGCSYAPEIIEAPNENSAQLNGTYSTVVFSANSSTVSKFDRTADVEYVNENQNDFDIRNLVFYNLMTGKSYPLVEDSIHILSFAVHKEFKQPLIFYRVAKKDYNKDGKFNSFDPVLLYTSNLDGTSFTQITPDTESFIDYTIYPLTHSILIKLAIDSNKDKKFQVNDETNFRMMDLESPKFAKNIFNDSLKSTLRRFN